MTSQMGSDVQYLAKASAVVLKQCWQDGRFKINPRRGCWYHSCFPFCLLSSLAAFWSMSQSWSAVTRNARTACYVYSSDRSQSLYTGGILDSQHKIKHAADTPLSAQAIRRQPEPPVLTHQQLTLSSQFYFIKWVPTIMNSSPQQSVWAAALRMLINFSRATSIHLSDKQEAGLPTLR